MADDHKELLLFGRAMPSKVDEDAFVERIVDTANDRNQNGSKETVAITHIPAKDIQQIAVGHNSIGFLFSDSRIARLGFNIVKNVVDTNEKTNSTSHSGSADNVAASTSADGSVVPPSAAGAAAAAGAPQAGSSASAALNAFGASSASAANRTAKIRRMMIAARRPGAISGRTGVIVDRSRAMLPASQIPEELIAQAQVVLQGKSREVIVRELQRTNLNVNEAVNNLLSRDDDEVDELDDAGEYLHEELLSLLDAGLRADGSAAALDGDGFYNAGENYEYMLTGESRKRDDSKSKERKADAAAAEVVQESFQFDSELQYWQCAEGDCGRRFTRIASTYSALVAIGDDGRVYTWNWNDERPSNQQHAINTQLFNETNATEKIVELATCAWRIAIASDKRRVASYVDDYFGATLASAFCTGWLGAPSGVVVEKLLVCPLYAAMQTSDAKLHWWGVFPFADRMQNFESIKKKSRDESTAKAAKEIIVGAEVCTRAIPIYAHGSVGINFSLGIPYIGILMESAWTMTETCRFRVCGRKYYTRYYESMLMFVDTPEQYAIHVRECERAAAKTPPKQQPPIDLNARKRAAPSGEAAGVGPSASKATVPVTSATYKEDAWSLRQVTFFSEEAVCDTAVVKIVDGSFVGVIYKSAIEQSGRESATGVANEAALLRHLRLMRKDELVVVPDVKISRSPQTFQTKLAEVRVPRRVKRIISSVVENNSFRMLAEKTTNELVVVTTNSSGTEVTEQAVPADTISLLTASGRNADKLTLDNYGDEDILVLRDAAGSIVPLIPDSAGGFREPVYIGFGYTPLLALGVRYVQAADLTCGILSSHPTLDAALLRKNDVAKNVQRVTLVAALVAPEPRTAAPTIDSLVQNVQYCDLAGVQRVLHQLESDATEEERRFQIVHALTDGNRNLFHTAVMHSTSAKNRDQADTFGAVSVNEAGAVSAEEAPPPMSTPSASSSRRGGGGGSAEKMSTSEADAVGQKFDQRWREMISSGTDAALKMLQSQKPTPSPKTPRERRSAEKAAKREEAAAASAAATLSRSSSQRQIPTNPKMRQRNAILIVAELASSAVVAPYFGELMQQQDIHGHTPFYAAINSRAYTSAMLMWRRLHSLEISAGRGDAVTMSAWAKSGEAKETPLFLLGYNDTCSFTWTGDEHINQDIFECKTCGLIGSLCCCTECAYTCHRNHDCRLKRTSPTAYCDCWEKCSCRALIVGNQTQRENLLLALLTDTSLIDTTNAQGEHMLLFFARTVGRQLVEQDNPRRLSTKLRPPQPLATSTGAATEPPTPEHDQEPPRFAQTALLLLLRRWDAVKSLLEVGMQNQAPNLPMTEAAFYLSSQEGASHLDQFVFTVLARCPEMYLDALLDTLVREANRPPGERDPKAGALTSRFVRSVVRLFSFLCTSSQQAMATVLAAIACNLGAEVEASEQTTALATSTPSGRDAPKSALPNYRTITVSGVLSLVRTTLPQSYAGSSSKENRKKQINSFVLKSRRVFQVLITYAMTELLNTTEALMAPVRHGVVRPCAPVHQCVSSTDTLDQLERCLFGDSDHAFAARGPGGSTRSRKGRRKRSPASHSALDGGGYRGRGGAGGGDSDNSDSEDSDAPHGAGGGAHSRADDRASAANGIAEKTATRSMNGALEEAVNGAYSAPAPASHNRRLSSSTVSTDDEDEHDDEEEDLGVLDEIDDEHYAEDEENEHYFRIEEEDAIDNSADEYSDEDHYYSSEGEHSPYTFDEVVDVTDGNETAAAASRSGDAQAATAGDGEQRGTAAAASGDRRKRNSDSRRGGRRHHHNQDASAAAARGGESGGDAASGHRSGATSGERSRNVDSSEAAAVEQPPVANAAHAEPANAAQPVYRPPESSASRSASHSLNRADTNAPDVSESAAGDRGGDASIAAAPSGMRVLGLLRGANTLGEASTVARDRATNERGASSAVGAMATSRTGRSAHHAGHSSHAATSWAARRARAHEEAEDAAAAAAQSRERASARVPPTDNNNAAETAAAAAATAGETRASKPSRARYADSADADVFTAKVQLAASFVVLVKTTDELLLQLSRYDKLTLNGSIAELLRLPTLAATVDLFKKALTERLDATWSWFARILDRLEMTLRFGNAYLKSPAGVDWRPDVLLANGRGDRQLSRLGRRADRKDDATTQARYEFFGYFMSLMRTHTAEAADDLPYLQPAPYQHMALIAEAYLFHINVLELVENRSRAAAQAAPPTAAPDSGPVSSKELRRFYRRSASISYPQMSHADSQAAFKHGAGAALPLTTRSTLLRPEAERTELFALPAHERTADEHRRLAREHSHSHPTQMSLGEPPFTCAGVTGETTDEGDDDVMEVDEASSCIAAAKSADDEPATGATGVQLQRTLGRWGNAMSYLAKAFNEDLITHCGNESFNSILLNEVGGFYLKQTQFKARMEKYKNTLTKDLNFSQLTRDKPTLITDVFSYLNQQYSRRTASATSSTAAAACGSNGGGGGNGASSGGTSSASPPLGATRVKATFRDEPGEGSGVVRSFYAAFAEAIADMEHLPLFRRTSRHGFLAPVGDATSATLKAAFRNVGRMMGICLQQIEILPLPLSRHVIKSILGRPITWYDMAFYDPDQFDALRSIAYNEATGELHDDAFYEDLSINFVMDVPTEEGGGFVELKPGGESISVTRDNVLEYLYLFVEKRLIGRHSRALEMLRQGVFDVIPTDSLVGLTSEDVRLMLCGTEHVSIRLLESFTTFMDESSSKADTVSKYKRLFYGVVSKFTEREKQDLLFFWTGSPAMPSSEEAFTPLPTVMIRPADDQHLPTANTCISRLYLPLYSSKRILRAKLAAAIQTRDFGFV